MPPHRTNDHQPGLLQKLRAGLLALALIVPPVAIADEQPAAAACVSHWHTTDIVPQVRGTLERYSHWKQIPHNSACRDVNVSWVSHDGPIKAQYRLRNGQVRSGRAGWRVLDPGVQRPWPVLITNLRNGTPYRIVSHDLGGWYQTPV